MVRQNFFVGAVILAVANAISKILGAIFKIPLTYIIGEEGMAVYNTAFGVYVMFLSFVISGIPFAVSKLVSEYLSVGKISKMRYTVKAASGILLIIGFLCSAALYFGADFFAIAMKEKNAAFAIKMIAPSVIIVAAGAGIRSYFQGLSNMLPTATSQIAEAFTKLVAGYALAKLFFSYGINAAAGGAVLGVTVGEAVATGVFILMYICSKKEYVRCTREEKRSVIYAMTDIAVPLLLASVTSSMLSVTETGIIRRELILSGIGISEARKLYGAYSGYAMTVFHLPVGMLSALGVSLLPVISGGFAANELMRVKRAALTAIKLILMFSLPCAVIMLFMSSEILSILFNNTFSSNMLMLSAPFLPVICISNILTLIIQAAGKIKLSFVCSTAVMILKIIILLFTVKRIGIYGVIIASGISSVLAVSVNFIVTKKLIGLKFKAMDTFIKPLISAVVMCAVMALIKKPIENYIDGNIISMLVICGTAFFAYLLMLILTGTLKIAFGNGEYTNCLQFCHKNAG